MKRRFLNILFVEAGFKPPSTFIINQFIPVNSWLIK
jgi:hypothetical protein